MTVHTPGALLWREGSARGAARRVRHAMRAHAGFEAARLLDFIVAGLLAPAALVLTAIALLFGMRLRSARVAGRDGRAFTLYSLERWLARVPWVWGLLRGDLSLVGPAPAAASEVDATRREERRRRRVAPGLVSLWWLRQRTSIDYGSEAAADIEYSLHRSVAYNAGVLARSAVAALYGAGSASDGAEVRMLGLRIDNVTMDEALEAILDPRPGLQVSFLNADCVNRAMRDPEYHETLRTSGLCLADGIGLRIAGKILHQPIRQNVNGTDLFPRLCERLQRGGGSLFLLGARPGVAGAVAHWVREHFPGVRIAGAEHGYFDAADEERILAAINATRPDVLMVAFGAPRQEKWIRRMLPRLRVGAALGVGGLFDFYSGRIPRAPQWLREMGLEWTYRLYQEPGRMWRRYLVGNAEFLGRILLARISPGRASAPALDGGQKQ